MKCLRQVTKYKCCGKNIIVKLRPIVDDNESDKIIVSGHPCYDCQQKMIGKRVVVIRYGDMPANGKSYNYRDNKYENGVSCYLPWMRPRPEFVEDRNKIKLSAVVVDFGGDDEPLIDKKTALIVN